MNRVKYLLLLTSIVFIGCGSDTTQNSSDSITSQGTMSVYAGKDIRAEINKIVNIVGEGSVTDGSKISFTWTKGDEVLATTPIFNYMPTALGVDTLTLTAKHISGKSISNSMRVTVLASSVDISQIPPISQKSSKEYLFEINEARSKEQNCGEEGIFPPTHKLVWNEKLYKSAYEHIQDLIKSKTFSHIGSGTESDWTGVVIGRPSTPSDRIDTYRYNWKSNAENIGAGTNIETAKEIVQAWIDSPTHCANLMSSSFKDVGMAMIKDEDTKYINYWGQSFGEER